MAKKPTREKAPIPERAKARGTMLWNEAFTQGIADELADWDPEFNELFMNFVYGGVYDRDVLPHETRELCAIAACVMANAQPQLRTHLFAAANCGATKREMMEVILQMTVYCDAPYMLQAARIAQREVFPAIDAGDTSPTPPKVD